MRKMGMARKIDGVWLVRDEFVVSRYDFEGTADEVKACIDLAVDKARNMGMVGEGRFDLTTERDYYGSYEIVITYYFERLETDKEKDKREKLEAKIKADAAAKRKKAAAMRKLIKDAEFAEYERLKAKFEGM
jgi:hypothetical protein